MFQYYLSIYYIYGRYRVQLGLSLKNKLSFYSVQIWTDAFYGILCIVLLHS